MEEALNSYDTSPLTPESLLDTVQQKLETGDREHAQVLLEQHLSDIRSSRVDLDITVDHYALLVSAGPLLAPENWYDKIDISAIILRYDNLQVVYTYGTCTAQGGMLVPWTTCLLEGGVFAIWGIWQQNLIKIGVIT